MLNSNSCVVRKKNSERNKPPFPPPPPLQVKWSVPKWNLRFNSKKSKVMVIGKNLNKNSNWVLGNEKIDEVNEYKYLGHFINRSMKSNYHINT